MFNSLLSVVWGRFESRQECLKFVRLAAIFAFTIGVYWIINPTKEVVFFHTVGVEYLPYARIVAIFCLIPAIMLYAKLVDLFERHHVFYILSASFGTLSLCFGYLMIHPTIGLANEVLDKWRLLGWGWFAFVEIFILIMVTVFWSFASDTSTPESAKRGFSLIAVGAQVGGILGPLAFKNAALVWGPVPFAFIGGIGIFIIGILVFYFIKVTPDSELAGFKNHEIQHKPKGYKRPGFFEGLRLITSSGYLLGITGIVMLYDMVSMIIDLHVKTLAQTVFPSMNELNCFFFKFALMTNGTALLWLLLGIGSVGRWLGTKKTLLILPLLLLGSLFLIYFYFTLPVLLVIYVISKGINYALNQPTKEQLYIPTSKESKYKAKAWIDMFGLGLAKSLGSSVHILRSVLQSSFVGVSSLLCGGLIGIWILAVLFVGEAHQKAVREDKVIC